MYVFLYSKCCNIYIQCLAVYWVVSIFAWLNHQRLFLQRWLSGKDVNTSVLHVKSKKSTCVL